MNTLDIYQIYYKSEQIKETDPNFPLYENIQTEEDLKIYNYNFREYGIFLKEYQKTVKFLKEETNYYLGYVSWKFYQKNQISISQFAEFIRLNPGYDVYFIDPFNQVTQKFNNSWDAGEFYHPGLKEITRQIFKESGVDTAIIYKTYNKYNMGFCNYWVANKKFWDLYINYTKSFYFTILNHIDLKSELSKQFLSIADSQVDSNYIPYFFERLFSTLLEINENSIKSRKITEKEKFSYRSPIKNFINKIFKKK